MSFMEPETYVGAYLEIDGPCGIDFIPRDVADITDADLEQWQTEVTDALLCKLPIPACLRDYTENRDAYSIERSNGILSRYSAPGYLDCTNWQLGDEADLAETYDVCPTCHEQCWDTDEPCTKTKEQ